MTIVFFGTPAFAVPSLRALLEAGHTVSLVVTQLDKPAGRGRATQASAVKLFALERGLGVAQPEKVRDAAFVERLRSLAPDVLAVAAYGKILPRTVLEIPRLGALNVHGSLLPRYRGAAPIQRAILAGESTTGVSIMLMNERMDAGDVLERHPLEIAADETTDSLSRRMSTLGGTALVEALARWSRGEITPEPQREEEATLAPLVRKEEGEIDWSRSAVEIERALRAFTPWPGAYTRAGGKGLKIHRAEALPETTESAPGTILRANDRAIWIATGAGVLSPLELQLEGRKRLGTRDFLAGGGLRGVERLGR